MPKTDSGTLKRSRALQLHLIVYGCASVVFFIADQVMTGAQWFHWPVMAWGVVAGIHLLYCKSIDVDQDWAERRAIDVRLKSYDLGHISAIDESFRKDHPQDPSSRPPDR